MKMKSGMKDNLCFRENENIKRVAKAFDMTRMKFNDVFFLDFGPQAM